jgi:hypothetical protein
LLRYLIIACLILSRLATAPAIAAPPPADFAKAVTFIFLADNQGQPRLDPQNNTPVANGTGFFVGVENDGHTGVYGYLVTAKHVLLDEHGQFLPRVFLRVNNKTEGSAFISLDLQPSGEKHNVFLHSDSTVDVAVIPVLPPEAIFDFRIVPLTMILTKDEFKKTTIAPGSDVFFTGLFAPYYGDKINMPIFRFGRVAMLPTDRIRWQEAGKPLQLAELYLLETMSFGGNSGSPVFFSQGMDRQPGSVILGPPIITLAGVMRGNFNEPRLGALIQTPNAIAPVFAQNVGIAAVTPAYLLHDILFSDQLSKMRVDNPIKNAP